MSQSPQSVRIRGVDFPAGIASAADVEKLGALLNPIIRSVGELAGNGITLTDNDRCDLIPAKVSHGVQFAVRLQHLQKAASCIVRGCDKAIPLFAGVKMQNAYQALVTVWFQDPTAAGVNVLLEFREEGQGLTAASYVNAIASGLATLVAGAVTVTAPTVQATSRILLSRQIAAGTVGVPQVGTITAGASFLINSVQPGTTSTLQAADTSTIAWMVVN